MCSTTCEDAEQLPHKKKIYLHLAWYWNTSSLDTDATRYTLTTTGSPVCELFVTPSFNYGVSVSVKHRVPHMGICLPLCYCFLEMYLRWWIGTLNLVETCLGRIYYSLRSRYQAFHSNPMRAKLCSPMFCLLLLNIWYVCGLVIIFAAS